MPDSEQESAPESVETAAPPAPKLSPPSGASQPSAPSADLDLLVDKLAGRLLPVLEEQAKKFAQSNKDRGISNVEKGLTALHGEMETFKTYLDAAGGDTYKAAREMAVSELLAKGTSQPDPGRSWGAEWRDGSEAILKAAAEDFGVKMERNDPDFLAVERGEYANPAEAFAAVTRFAARKAKQAQTGVAAVAAEGTGAVQSTEDATSLAKKLSDQRFGADRKTRTETLEKLKKAVASEGLVLTNKR